VDAKTLFQQGVSAIRDQNNPQLGRDLLIQSLKLNPQNDMAWLWLTRTVRDRDKQLEYVERALKVNPNNEAALKLKIRLDVTPPFAVAEPKPEPVSDVAVPAAASAYLTVATPVSPEEKERIATLMDRANTYMEAGNTEAAIGQWVEVLNIRVDHETALRHATGHLWRLQYRSDARELVQRALDAGTMVPSIYMTAIDISERLGEHTRAEELRQRVASLPQAGDQAIMTVADDYIQRYRLDQALDFLKSAHEAHPDSQGIMIKIGDLLQQLERPQEAMTYYDLAVRTGPRTNEGKEADQKLLTFVPILTDRERGSVWLALREVIGLGLFYLIMGWQDASLSLLEMGPRRWIGVAFSVIGGYLFVTATSSPQQRRIAGWFGGAIPPVIADLNQPHSTPGRALEEPTQLPMISREVRYVLGSMGVVLLVVAFALVFHQTLHQVSTNPPPYLPWSGD
jgi:tetratricopeptide (TPR) repeat protein